MAAENTALNAARRSSHALALLLLAALAACTAPAPYQLPPPPVAPVVVEPPKEVVAPPPAPPPAPVQAPAPAPKEVAEPPSRAFHLGAAAQALVNQAHAQTGRGEYPAASGTLDRALRIEPQNPLLWVELAHLRLSEGDLKQAEHCARRALVLGSADTSVRQSAGHLLADVLRAQHRDDEAKDLEDQPWMN